MVGHPLVVDPHKLQNPAVPIEPQLFGLPPPTQAVSEDSLRLLDCLNPIGWVARSDHREGRANEV